jgi:hypothetical protein
VLQVEDNMAILNELEFSPEDLQSIDRILAE